MARRESENERQKTADPETSAALDEIAELLPSGAASIRVYLVSPLPPEFQGRMPRVYTFDDPMALAAHADPEAEIERVLREQGCWDGAYEVRAYDVDKDGRPYIKWKRSLGVKTGIKYGAGAGLAGGTGNTDAVAQAIEALAKLGIKAPDNAGPQQLGSLLSEGLKAGIEVAKTHHSEEGRVTSAMTELVKAILQKPDQLSQLAPLIQPVVGVLINKLLEQPKQPTLAEQLRELREAGLWPSEGGGSEGSPAEEPDEFERVERALATLQRFQSLFGTGTAKPDWWWALLHNPEIPRLASEFFRTIQMGMMMKSGVPGQQWARIAQAPPPAASAAAPAGGGQAISPVLAQAIQEQDTSAFPMLAEMIRRMAPPVLDAMASGQLRWEQFLQSFGRAIPELNLPGAQAYYQAFVEWLRGGSVAQTEPSDGNAGEAEQIAVTCDNPACDVVWYMTPEEWQHDDKVCNAELKTGGRCQGRLQRKDENTPV